jgi:hypothetical protein
MNWYLSRMGFKSSVRMQGRRVGMLAAVSGCGGASPSVPSKATVCAALLPVLACSLPSSQSGGVLLCKHRYEVKNRDI